MLLAGIAFLIAGQSPDSDKRESFAVMTVVLDSLYHSDGDRATTVVVADSLFWREGGMAYAGKLLLPHKSTVDPATIADFESKTTRSTDFPRGFRYRRLVLHNTGAWKAFSERGAEIAKATRDNNQDPFWLAFAEKYPRAWGLTFLSRVAFNADKSEALILVRHQCGNNCGSSEVMLLRKSRAKWRIVERIAGQSWEGLGAGSLRYLGTGRHRIIDVRKQQDSTRRAIADSIRRDRAPRRIRGTVYNRFTGTPLARAQIFARSSAPYPTGTVQRAVADSKGRYEIRNPPIGGMMLEVQCPGPGHRLGATLDAPGLYVFPMTDTIIDVGPPYLEPCWFPRQPHKILSGELEGRLKNPPVHPTPSELQIYDLILRATRVDSSPVLLEAETSAWCDWNWNCPKLSLQHLVRSGEVDSSVVTSFRAVRQDTIALNPAAFTAIDVRLITRGQWAYLKREGSQAAQFSADTTGAVSAWGFLRKLFGTGTITSVSRAAFSDTGDQAIVSVRSRSATDRFDETLFLKRVNGSWQISRRHLEDERPSAKLESDECVAISKSPAARSVDLNQILGDYDFSLISSSTDHHVVPWRMRFLRDSARRTVFEVLDPTTGTRVKYFEPGTHIGNGDGGFENASGLWQLDGSGYAMTITAVESDRFFGYWEHYSFGIPVRRGKAVAEPAGHFCAVRRKTSQ